MQSLVFVTYLFESYQRKTLGFGSTPPTLVKEGLKRILTRGLTSSPNTGICYETFVLWLSIQFLLVILSTQSVHTSGCTVLQLETFFVKTAK